MKKAIVIYFSWTNGNTERIAKKLAGALGGAELLRIEAPDDYQDDDQTVVSQAQEDVKRGYRPRIAPASIDLSAYDVVGVGGPTWWYTVATPMLTLLDTADFSGKTVVPFTTHGGWPAHALADIGNGCRGAKRVVKGLAVQFDSSGGSRMVTTEKQLEDWLASVKKDVE
jgi:flavodoxin